MPSYDNFIFNPNINLAEKFTFVSIEKELWMQTYTHELIITVN